ncbi:MAG: 1-aminocyclopropane-1-carboxylate deaminase/D-cysteine desulfhydrase [Flavisolibacter sp.]
MKPDLSNIKVQQVPFLQNFRTTVDVLRLDLLHPVISGNKWFKLNRYIDDARAKNKTTLLTFGGAYSNHIVATSAAAAAQGFQSVGIIRGEEPLEYSPTLLQAADYGMKLFFVNREVYRSKEVPPQVYESMAEKDIYCIEEGGFGEKGAEGAAEILHLTHENYSHIITAVGTGTTAAGLLKAAAPEQKVIGISVMKNNLALQPQIENLVNEEKRQQLTLLHDYHFGGYAKKTAELIAFMNQFYQQTSIPTDFVYTGKLFFAVKDLLQKKYFPDQSRILVIHSGGLQGNRSLSKGTLIF